MCLPVVDDVVGVVNPESGTPVHPLFMFMAGVAVLVCCGVVLLSELTIVRIDSVKVNHKY